MLAAQLRGKLTREEESLEDLLTSNVFGSIRYVPPEDGLIPLLSSAEEVNGTNPLKELPEISDVAYDFWRRLEEENCNPCEPDVLINIIHANKAQTTLLVEAKYKSGKSSESDEGDKPNDQLAKEWDNLVVLAKRNKLRPYLLYITADMGFPREDIESSQSDYFKTRGGKMDIVWISWRKMPIIFHDSRYEILKDLVKVLRRQGLTFFEGFKLEHVEAIKWQFHTLVKQPLITPLNLNWSFSVPTIKWKYNNNALIHFDWTLVTYLRIKWRFT